MANKKKQFRRSSDNKIVSGVLAGVAEYYNQDPTVIRIVWLLVLGFTGFIPGILAYVVTVFIIPLDKPRKKHIR